MSDIKPVLGRPRVYQEIYPEDLINKMSQGLFDYEIYADWNISKDTFYRWLREYPDLKEAYEIGFAKCLKWWTTVGKKRCMALEDKGFKYWISIMNNKFGWGKEDARSSVTNNTQINVSGSVTVLQSKTDQELIETLTNNLDYLSRMNVLSTDIEEIKTITHDNSESNE